MKTDNSHKNTSTLFIKNMVCNRCIKVVKEELNKIGLEVKHIKLGEVEINISPEVLPLSEIKHVLEKNGFELIEDRKARLIEEIKIAVINLVYDDEAVSNKKMNLSDFIRAKVGYDYNYLSGLFSSIENITIEQFVILQKIERAKELLKYGQFTLSEISYKLGYSSVAHLSAQFKKVTGMTASQFNNQTDAKRFPIDKLNY